MSAEPPEETWELLAALDAVLCIEALFASVAEPAPEEFVDGHLDAADRLLASLCAKEQFSLPGSSESCTAVQFEGGASV